MPDLHAGKYAVYIWPAYGVTALVFAVLIVGAMSYAGRWRRRAEAAKRQAASEEAESA
jgi:heme exporter protein D